MFRSLKLASAVGLALALLGLVWTAASTPLQAAPTGGGGAVPIYPDQRTAVNAAVHWLIIYHQNQDGGYANFSGGANTAPSAIGGTLDAVLAIASTGHNPAASFMGRNTPIGYLQANPSAVASYASAEGGQAGRTLLALTAAHQDVRDFGGYNLVLSTTAQLSPTGQLNATTAYRQGLAILGLAAAHETIPVSATQWLIAQQQPNGAWDDGFGTLDAVDDTAIALMALIAAGEATTSTAVLSATQFLRDAQTTQAGWGYSPSFPGQSANSTALALQALRALGEDFYSPTSSWAVSGTTPISALLSFQNSTGAFQADFGQGPFDDFYSTVQAIPAATGKAYPLAGRHEAARLAIACLASLQDPATAGWEQFVGSGPNAGGTSRALQAIAAYGGDPSAPHWVYSDTTPLDALASFTPAYLSAGRGGRVGIVAQGVVAGGGVVTDFAGFNLPISITAYLSPTGEYDHTNFGPFAHGEALLGLLAAGEMPAPVAISYTANLDFSVLGADAAGITLHALAKAGVMAPSAVARLEQTQLATAGWGYGGVANANSSAEAAQGLVAAGQNPFAPSWSKVVSGTLLNAAEVIIAQQQPDGCWPNLFGSGNDPFALTDAILLLTLEPQWPPRTAVYLPLVVR